MKKVVAIGLFCSIGMAFFAGFFSQFLLPNFVQAVTMLAGLGIMVFGIWAGVLLLKK
jgi:hypothetical protein